MNKKLRLYYVIVTHHALSRKVNVSPETHASAHGRQLDTEGSVGPQGQPTL